MAAVCCSCSLRFVSSSASVEELRKTNAKLEFACAIPFSFFPHVIFISLRHEIETSFDFKLPSRAKHSNNSLASNIDARAAAGARGLKLVNYK